MYTDGRNILGERHTPGIESKTCSDPEESSMGEKIGRQRVTARELSRKMQ